MTALWIGLGGLVALLLVWRLRRASKKLDRILREEHTISEAERTVAKEAEQSEHPNR